MRAKSWSILWLNIAARREICGLAIVVQPRTHARVNRQNEVNAVRASDSCPNDVPHRKAAEGFLFLPCDLRLRRGTATPGNESRDTDDDAASQGPLRIFRACQRKGSAEARGDGGYRR